MGLLEGILSNIGVITGRHMRISTMGMNSQVSTTDKNLDRLSDFLSREIKKIIFSGTDTQWSTHFSWHSQRY